MSYDIAKYKLGWVMYRDEVLLDDIASIGRIDEDRLIEARFTDANEELHIWRDNDDRLASHVTGISGDTIPNEYTLLKKFGKSIKLIDIIEYDDDGQAFVTYTAFAVFEKGV